ncbi:acetyltransferase [Winogradskyella psychrotolerans RS-3]|uniref:Acetyltransferase n=1 Tax=Winogradskyella psychrotolerans RS-3 TaxID=641526 RepID=S7X6T1_9FLAO|nr:acetyltransferase [Winogradskyella psychrotolerans RS-3]
MKIDFFTKLEKNIKIGKGCDVSSSIIGTGTYISENSSIRNTKVGRFCAIADNVRTGMGSHPTKEFVSIHPAFFSTIGQAGFTFVHKNVFEELPKVSKSKYVVEIGNDVWIGSGVKIVDGVTIGDGAIIGANAIVTKDVEPYSINVGVPAKLIKFRFSMDEIAFLEKFKWWDKEFDWIKNNASKFINIKTLMSEHK